MQPQNPTRPTDQPTYAFPSICELQQNKTTDIHLSTASFFYPFFPHFNIYSYTFRQDHPHNSQQTFRLRLCLLLVLQSLKRMVKQHDPQASSSPQSWALLSLTTSRSRGLAHDAGVAEAPDTSRAPNVSGRGATTSNAYVVAHVIHNGRAEGIRPLAEHALEITGDTLQDDR